MSMWYANAFELQSFKNIIKAGLGQIIVKERPQHGIKQAQKNSKWCLLSGLMV